MNIIKSSVNNWIKIISVVLAVFVFSFGEIALNDISKMFDYPGFDDILENLKTDGEKENFKILQKQYEDISNTVSLKEDNLGDISENIKDIEETLDQLLEGQEISPDSETGKLKSSFQKNFIELQKEREELKKEISGLKRNLSDVKSGLDKYHEDINEKYKDKASEIQEDEKKSVEIRILVFQLILLLILSGIAVFLYLKFRNTKYIYPVTGYSSAIALMTAQAIYIHSPFKLHYYVFIFIGIAACIAVIIWLVKNLTKINRKETLAIVKKNLAAERCPGCSSYISIEERDISVKGKNRFRSFIIFIIICAALLGNGSGIVIFFDNINDITTSQLMYSVFLIIFPWIVLFVFMNIYTASGESKIPDPVQFRSRNCPVCGLELVRKCEKCGALRHALLPYCSSCGSSDDEIPES